MAQQELVGRVTKALKEIGYSEEEIRLEPTESKKVGGHIVSKKFKGESQIKRQEKLWKQLKEHLKHEDLVRIVALLTVTPAEISDDD